MGTTLMQLILPTDKAIHLTLLNLKTCSFEVIFW